MWNISPTFAALYAHVTFDPQWVNQMPFLLRFEPDILLRAKQDFMKTDSATDLEWVSFKIVHVRPSVFITSISMLYFTLPQVYDRTKPGTQWTLSRERARPWEGVSESHHLWRGEMWGSNSSVFHSSVLFVIQKQDVVDRTEVDTTDIHKLPRENQVSHILRKTWGDRNTAEGFSQEK